MLSQLAQKLNPFAKDDPFMKLDCTIARADIVNGQVTVKPVVIQTEKVTITAHGTIDLRTEKLLLDFNTRPRKGIGVSPGMFTNPLIRLEGTLVSPKIGVGAKGMASGALAAATGGATVVAGGLVDRVKGEQDMCTRRWRQPHDPPLPDPRQGAERLCGGCNQCTRRTPRRPASAVRRAARVQRLATLAGVFFCPMRLTT